MNGIEFYYTLSCHQCNKAFELRTLGDTDYYEKYEGDYCPSCRLQLLAKDGIAKYSYLRGATITGYSIEAIEENPELRYIEILLTDNTTIRIDVKNTRWLSRWCL